MNAHRPHKPRHWSVGFLLAVAALVLVLAVAGVAFLEMSHPLTAAIISIR